MTAVVYSSLTATPSNDVKLPTTAARQQQYSTMLPPALTPTPPPSSVPLYGSGPGVELMMRSNGGEYYAYLLVVPAHQTIGIRVVLRRMIRALSVPLPRCGRCTIFFPSVPT
jgi:hypothetical protein